MPGKSKKQPKKPPKPPEKRLPLFAWRAEMVLRKARYNALIAGTGPLQNPRDQYVTAQEAAQLKGVGPSRIKRAVLEEHLKAECTEPPHLLIRRVDLDAAKIRGKYRNNHWETRMEYRRQEHLKGVR